MTRIPPTVIPQIHLKPGHIFVTREPQVVATVLGSCVAVTMFDRRTGLASICHAMLSHPPPEKPVPKDDPQRFRYVSHALPAMFDTFRRANVDLGHLEVKVFGGANIIAHAHHPPAMSLIGDANIKAVRALLRHARLAIAAENTGGYRGRKILFNTVTGEVLHKHLADQRP